jgi:hypothetical protein
MFQLSDVTKYAEGDGEKFTLLQLHIRIILNFDLTNSF